MGLPINIEKLLTGETVESERIEYKGNNPEAIMQAICAFANDFNNWGGGYVIVGIATNSGVPILPPEGLQNNQIDPLQQNIINVCYQIEPTYTPVIEVVNYMSKQVLVIWVPGGDGRPYKAPEHLIKGAKKVYWIRKGSITTKPTQQDEQKLFEKAAKIPFDDRINHVTDVDVFSRDLITSYLKGVKSDLLTQMPQLTHEDLCRQMGIARGATEYFKPINVGLLMFNDNPHSFFRGAIIEVIIYHDLIGDDFDEKKFTGPLNKQLIDALNYIRVNVIKHKTKKILGSAEALTFYNYPFNAIEEALANAIFHRSYESESTIEVNVRLDKIEILSYPGPLPPLNKAKLKKKKMLARDYRNRRIGDFLKELKLTEGRGTGVPKIIDAMYQNYSPVPEFETDDDCTYFLTTLPINRGFLELKLNEHLLSILEYCNTPHSKSEILGTLGLSNHPDNARRYISPLMDVGYLTYTLPNVPTSRKQKYVTSQSGHKRLANNR